MPSFSILLCIIITDHCHAQLLSILFECSECVVSNASIKYVNYVYTKEERSFVACRSGAAMRALCIVVSVAIVVSTRSYPALMYSINKNTIKPLVKLPACSKTTHNNYGLFYYRQVVLEIDDNCTILVVCPYFARTRPLPSTYFAFSPYTARITATMATI